MPRFVVYRVFYLYEFLLLSMFSTSHIWESDLKQQVQLVDGSRDDYIHSS